MADLTPLPPGPPQGFGPSSSGKTDSSAPVPTVTWVALATGVIAIAGVVGNSKFAFDIWGDTVNIAARIEQAGEGGKINISGESYELIREFFPCTYRGKIAAKNKGEIDMYYVEN